MASFRGVGGVGFYSHDNICVFIRGENPMMIFDRDLLSAWDEGQYSGALIHLLR
jgi:hypothetical protein